VHSRAEELIRTLGLQPHPEGGWYREVYRSVRRVQPFDSRSARAALTVIYFLLADGAHSRWHRVSSDEAWTWVEGDALELHRIDTGLSEATARTLAAPGDGIGATAVIPAGDWQAARTTGAYTLVTCTVGPGFDFADFTMMADDAETSELVRRTLPDAAGLIG
jgi:predicted cupin superfamily sugar epimerase